VQKHETKESFIKNFFHIGISTSL